MKSLNKVELIGNLGSNPELKVLQSGAKTVAVGIATNESYKDKAGERQERTEWHNLVFFNQLAEIVGKYLKKGSKVYVEGSLRTRKWAGKDGIDRYTTEVVVKEMMMLDNGRSPAQSAPSAPATTNTSSQAPALAEGFDEDAPF